jgi:hypothetical protein
VRILQRDAAEVDRRRWEVGGRPKVDHTPGTIEGEESLASRSSCWTKENANPSPGLKHHRLRERWLFLMGEVGGDEARIEGEEDRHEDEEDTREVEGEHHEGEDSEDDSTLEVGAVVAAALELGAAGLVLEWTMGCPFAQLLADSHSSWSVPCP